MVVTLIVCNRFRCFNFSEEFLTRSDRESAQISSAIKDLIDVEVDLEEAAKIDAESSEEWLPEGVLLDALLLHVEVEEWIRPVKLL